MTTSHADPPKKALFGDDIAYILPMAIFLILVQVGNWWPVTYETVYIARTVLAAAALAFCWKQYTPIVWKHLPLAVAAGVIALVLWIGVEKLVPNYPRLPHDVFDPYQAMPNPVWRWTFILIRWTGATLVAPVMEELFWRDFLWRSIIAPADFKLAHIGEWDWKAFVIVALICAGVHPQWLTAIIWALGIGLLLVFTRSLGACIVCHAVTNFLLGAYVLYTHDWAFW